MKMLSTLTAPKDMAAFILKDQKGLLMSDAVQLPPHRSLELPYLTDVELVDQLADLDLSELTVP